MAFFAPLNDIITGAIATIKTGIKNTIINSMLVIVIPSDKNRTVFAFKINSFVANIANFNPLNAITTLTNTTNIISS